MIGYKPDGSKPEDFVEFLDKQEIRPASKTYYQNPPLYPALFSGAFGPRVLVENFNAVLDFAERFKQGCEQIQNALGKKPYHMTVPYLNQAPNGGVAYTSIPMRLLEEPGLLDKIIEKCKRRILFNGTFYDLYYGIMEEVINMTAE